MPFFPSDDCRPFFARLEALYAEMDRQYQAAAEYYGFECHGCDDNCCMTRFYHHTYIEYLYLYHAFERLDDELRHHIRQKACEVRTQTMATKECKNPQRLMCPLNFEERCRLYAWRPMICRLHGIAYELNFPSRGLMRGAGCHEFEKTVDQTPYKPFDRTPFYNKMASLEHDFKQALGLNRKIKKTIAEMLADELSLL